MRKTELPSQRFSNSPLETSLILADKGSPFGLDDNKLSIKLQTATQISNKFMQS